MENQQERAERLQSAQEDALRRYNGPTGLIPGSQTGAIPDQELLVVPNPVESSVYDALVYIREGMSRQEVLNALLIRNKISKDDANRIIDQVLVETAKEGNKSDTDATPEPVSEIREAGKLSEEVIAPTISDD